MRKLAALIVGTTAIVAIAPLPSSAAPLPTCAQLGTDPANGLFGNPQISALTVALTPAAGTNAAYCQINFTFSSESGPAFGYFNSGAGAAEHIKIRVGLPLSAADGGTGGVQGAWNGKTRDLGGGGYAGAVGGVTASTNLGYVGTSTDTGHNTAQDGPGGAFALNPDGTLNQGLIKDFAGDGIHQQGVWGVKLAKTYYGTDPTRKYWVGCSTGGRQGHYLAQNYPDFYDGILAGANAFNWDRFITSELWPQIVMKDSAGGPIPSAKLTAVTNAAIAACDGLDGVVDGMLEDPRACTYSATSFVCVANGGTSTDPNCLTPGQASAVDKIWDGPKDPSSRQAWYGLERGTPLGSLAGTNPFSIATDHFKYWIKQDASFDWHTVTEASFFSDILTSIAKFNTSIGTDDNLVQFRAKGGKMITYHGLADPLIFPRGTMHYYNSIPGGLNNTQNYYRHFPYPAAGHCGGAGINGTDQFNALVNWVENGVAPDHFVAQVTPTRTRKVCMYPNVQVYNGSGSSDDQANFTCQEMKKDPLIDTLKIDAPYETDVNNNNPGRS